MKEGYCYWRKQCYVKNNLLLYIFAGSIWLVKNVDNINNKEYIEPEIIT